MLNEPKQMNSGTPQGVFLKRQMVLKSDGSGLPILPNDFVVGNDIGISGRSIRIYDCDEYTREYFKNLKMEQPPALSCDSGNFEESQKPVPTKKDPEMKEFLEKSLGGGKVKSQKQFLDNDLKVLRFFCKYDDLPYVIHYYLADDTVEIREIHHPNDGRDAFALLLRRQKLPDNFGVNQPGQTHIGDNYLTWDEIEPSKPVNAFGRYFRIQSVDAFTHQWYMDK